MGDKVLDFINRRFVNDNNWLDGNCYYFAVILKTRFPEGKILYDVVGGHFVFSLKNKKYDWSGIVINNEYSKYIEWDKFEDYDSKQLRSVIEGCIL